MFAFLGGYADRLRSDRNSIHQLIDCEGSSAGTPSQIDLRLGNSISDVLSSRPLRTQKGFPVNIERCRAVAAPITTIL